MRVEEVVELAKLHGIDLNGVELTDANLEAVVGGLQKGPGGFPGNNGVFGSKSFSGQRF